MTGGADALGGGSVKGGGGGGSGGPGQANNTGHGVYGTPTNITGPGITPTEYFTAYGGGGGAGSDLTAPTNSSDVVNVYGGSGGGIKISSIGNGNAVSNPPSFPTVTPLAPYRPDGIPQGFPGGVGGDGTAGGGGGGASESGKDQPQPAVSGFGGNGKRVFAGDAGLEPANTPGTLTIGQAADPAWSLLPGRYVGGGGGAPANNVAGGSGGTGIVVVEEYS